MSGKLICFSKSARAIEKSKIDNRFSGENRRSFIAVYCSIVHCSLVPFLFEKLDVYQKAVSLAEETMTLADGFAKGNYAIVDQLNRAALSISLNIAEGNGRYHKADRKHFFIIARGSAFECVPILEICARKGLISEEKNSYLKARLDEISKMLTGLIDF